MKKIKSSAILFLFLSLFNKLHAQNNSSSLTYEDALSISNYQKDSPSFIEITLNFSQDPNQPKEQTVNIFEADPSTIIGIMQLLLIQTEDTMKQFVGKLKLNDRRFMEISKNKGSDENSFDPSMMEVWQQAAKKTLLQLALDHSLENILPSDRRKAASTLLYSLHQIDDKAKDKLAGPFVKTFFSSCRDFMDCHEMLTEIARSDDVLADVIINDSWIDQIENNLDQIKNPFLSMILKFRLNTLLNYSYFYHFTGLHALSSKGKVPTLTKEQAQAIRERIDGTISQVGLWHQAIGFVRDQYSKKEGANENDMPTDFELMTEEVANYFILSMIFPSKENNQSDEAGLMAPAWRNRSLAQKEKIKNGNDVLKAEMLKTFPAQIVQGFYMTYYSNLALKYYLKRCENKSADPFLNIFETVLKHGVYEQESINPIGAFFTFIHFSKYEFYLPNRYRWFDLQQKYLEALRSGFLKFQDNSEFGGNRDFISPAFIDFQETILRSQFQEISKFTENFIQASIFTKVWTKESSHKKEFLNELEKWASINISGFHSFYFQFLSSGEHLFLLEKAILSYNQEKDENKKTEYMEKHVLPNYENLLQKYLTFACVGYFIPVSPDGKIVQESFNKKDWQNNFSFQIPGMDQLDFDLKKICGNNTQNISQTVFNYLRYESEKTLAKGDWRDYADALAPIAGDTVILLGSGYLAGKLLGKLVFKSFIGQTFSSFANLALFMTIRRVTYFGMDQIQEKTGLLRFMPAQKFSGWGNEISNFGTDFAIGAPIILLMPAFNALALRQVYTKSALPFGKKFSHLSSQQIEQYYIMRGTRVYDKTLSSFTYNPGGYSMREEFMSIALPMSYQMGAYTGISFFMNYSQTKILLSKEGRDWKHLQPFLSNQVMPTFAYTSAFSSFRIFYINRMVRNKTMQQTMERAAKGEATLEEIQSLNPPAKFELYRVLGLKPLKNYNIAELEKSFQEADQLRKYDVSTLRKAFNTLSDPEFKSAYDYQERMSGLRSYGANAMTDDLGIVMRFFYK